MFSTGCHDQTFMSHDDEALTDLTIDIDYYYHRVADPHNPSSF
jgi:hypothetical protein